MCGTNKLCMKGIYLPTFQRSIILRANEGYTQFTQLSTQLDNFWRETLVSLLVSLDIYNIHILYRFFSISLDKTSRYCGWTYLSNIIFATSACVFIRKTSLSAVHLSYSSPMHTLVLLDFAELSFLCCFLVESVNVFFHPRFNFSTCTSDQASETLVSPYINIRHNVLDCASFLINDIAKD